ncbi:MAG: hypothetical protein ACI9W4_001474 [Rhodothermales bacterium]|jgi:hypothetical protein
MVCRAVFAASFWQSDNDTRNGGMALRGATLSGTRYGRLGAMQPVGTPKDTNSVVSESVRPLLTLPGPDFARILLGHHPPARRRARTFPGGGSCQPDPKPGCEPLLGRRNGGLFPGSPVCLGALCWVYCGSSAPVRIGFPHPVPVRARLLRLGSERDGWRRSPTPRGSSTARSGRGDGPRSRGGLALVVCDWGDDGNRGRSGSTNPSVLESRPWRKSRMRAAAGV